MILALQKLIAPHTAGDPMNATKWLNCRLRDLQEQLVAAGHQVSIPLISRLLRAWDYRLRANRKEVEALPHPDRDTQFRHLLAQRTLHLDAGQPVISVDSKKKELIGNFKNAGQSWGQAAEVVNSHDFPTMASGRAVPYGIYDLLRNSGTLYVGQAADTPAFAVDNIADWCARELRLYYPAATALMIEADSGGSNSARSRVWKVALQRQVADSFGLAVTVCHYPRGCSKWNPVEHRLFSEISKTWAGCPLRSFELLLQYVRDTTTLGGLHVMAHLVTTAYETGVQVTDEEMSQLNLEQHSVCPAWNYTIRPRI